MVCDVGSRTYLILMFCFAVLNLEQVGQGLHRQSKAQAGKSSEGGTEKGLVVMERGGNIYFDLTGGGGGFLKIKIKIQSIEKFN